MEGREGHEVPLHRGYAYDSGEFPHVDGGSAQSESAQERERADINGGWRFRFIAVFQLESPGMQKLCRNLGVDKIEHIVALVALYRPGPMQFIPQFIARKKGEEEIEYDHPTMEPILQETYGIMIYQEQIMQVVQAVAGFSLGGADLLRRAIGKKKEYIMVEQRVKFIEGCKKTNDIDEELADAIWEKIKLFAGYGFNKSHSAAYGVVSYQTA